MRHTHKFFSWWWGMSENKMKNEFRQSFFIFDVKNVLNSKIVIFF